MSEQQEIISEAKRLLTKVFEDHQSKGIISIYLWGSIAREDFDPKISDVDSLAIIDKSMDLNLRPEIMKWLADNFSHDMKFGLQFYGVEELNGDDTYTLLGELQPPGYILLRFDEWVHVAGHRFDRADFAAPDMTPEQARQHQVDQVARSYKIIDGELPSDSRRSRKESVYEDIVKGALGALYWQTVIEGNVNTVNYDQLTDLVDRSLKPLAEKLAAIRERNAYTLESVTAIRPDLRQIL